MFNDLIEKLDQYLGGYISLEDFELWFYDLAFDVEKRYAGTIVEVVHDIEGTLAEASSGQWSRIALNNELESIAAKHRVNPTEEIKP